MNALFNFFASLRLTVWTLTLALVLVFVGTIAQVKMGLYIAQERYFQSFFVFWGPEGANWQIPIWPGGYLLGTVLLINLLAAHFKRFTFSKKKAGIFLTHFGLILLLVGQLFTELLQTESYMAIPEGQTRNYSESGRRSELAVVEVSDASRDKVVAVPEHVLSNHAGKSDITVKDLPFAIRVKEFHRNSQPEYGPMVGMRYAKMPRAIKMDDRDIPAATIEAVGKDGKPIGEWKVSNWEFEDQLVAAVHRDARQKGIKPPETFGKLPTFSHEGKEYTIMMRPVRYYKPFTMTLLDFSHDKYLGTSIPKNYSSKIRLVRAETGENSERLIYMNNPLRYWGETYYQGGFLPGDTGTILQVVRNPSWLTPYIACILVGGGLTLQFMIHLMGFIRKRKTAPAGAPAAVGAAA